MRRLRQWMSVLRVLIGVPDYDRYVRHMRARHPDRALLSKEEFVNARLNARYSRPGSRCC
jgi:uncharacterized short protein YbdD (DUF466 family)